MSLSKVELPKKYNYIACFLTLACNLKCGYCINSFNAGNGRKRKIIPAEKWIAGLNRLVSRPDLPVTLQGGEPSLHPDFIRIIKSIKKSLHIDILTNLNFDVDNFIKNIDPCRLRRKSLYPSIRVSYHPYYMDLGALMKKVLKMKAADFSIGIFGIIHPKFEREIFQAQKRCLDSGIDFRTKEFLGSYGGRVHGTYLYPEAIANRKRKRCLCRTSELIIGPDVGIYRCHHDLYRGFPPVSNLLDNDFKIRDDFRQCNEFGDCNPCDIKIKTNRFQRYGHTSVDIKDIRVRG